MRRIFTNPLVIAAVVTALSSAACSKSGGTSSPLAPTATASTPPSTSPSPSPSPTPATSVGATIAGVVISGAPALAQVASATVARVTVTVLGTSASTITDDNGNFTLHNVPVGSQTLSINGNGVAAQVSLASVSMHEQIRVTVRVDGGAATLDDRQRETTDSQVEVEGQITSASSGTIVVGRLNTAVVVPATATITRSGVTAKSSDLLPGLRVEVHGVKSGSTITATRVNIESEDTTSSGGNTTSRSDASETELTGAMTAKPTGSCPNLSFQVGTTTVVTNASTYFDDAVCSSLAAGDTVRVEGARQSNGSVVAKEVSRTSSSGSRGGSSNSDDDEDSDDRGDDNSGGSGSGGNSGGGSGSGRRGR